MGMAIPTGLWALTILIGVASAFLIIAARSRYAEMPPAQKAWRVACRDEACPWDNGLQPDRNLPGWEATPGVSEIARWLTAATEEAVALALCPPTPLPAESAACAGALAAAAESLLDKARRLELEIDLHGLAD